MRTEDPVQLDTEIPAMLKLDLIQAESSSNDHSEQNNEVIKQKAQLQREMLQIKKRISENCMKMDLYDVIAKLGKIICSHETLNKSRYISNKSCPLTTKQIL